MMRKAISILLALAMCLMFGSFTAASAAEEPTNLTVMCHSSWITAGTNATFDYVADKLNVTFTFLEQPEGDAGEQLIYAKILSGEAPDILWWQNARAAASRMGLEKFEDLTGPWMDNFVEGTMDSNMYVEEGNRIMVPFGDSNIYGICYNKQVFADAGVEVPTTFPELLEVCETIAAIGITPIYMSADPAATWSLQIWWENSFALEAKKDPTIGYQMNDNQATFMDLEYVIRAMENMVTFKNRGFINSTFLSDTYEDAQRALLYGEAAMYCMGSTWLAGELDKLTDDQAELNNIGIFPIPLNDNPDDTISLISPPTGLFLPADSPNKDLAKEVIFAIATPEAMQPKYDALPGLPFIKGVDGRAAGLIQGAADVINAGKVGINVDGILYHRGDLANYLQSMLMGDMTPMEVMEACYSEFSKHAVNEGNPNF